MYKAQKIEKNNSSIKYFKLRNLIGHLAFFLMFYIGVDVVAGNSTDYTSIDSNEELYRIALIQTFQRDYNGAIATYEAIIKRDSTECSAYQCLSELYLVKALEDFECESSKTYFLESKKYAEYVLDTYDEDLDAIVVKSLTLTNLSEFYVEEPEMSTALLITSINEIQKGLKVNKNYSDLWFALGEWWTYAINIPWEKRTQVLQNKFPQLESIENDFSCLNMQALNAYQEAVKCKPSSVKGLFGTMRVFLVEHNIEAFYDTKNEIQFLANYMPLENYYLEQAKKLWKSVELLRYDKRKDGEIGRNHQKQKESLSFNQY